MAIRAILFDAYGTLFDVHSIATLAQELFPPHGSRLAQQWRDTQIDYTRLRTLADRYRPFSKVTEDALVFALHKLGIESELQARNRLLDEYNRLDLFPEISATLETLKSLGLSLGVLSNGDSSMLGAVLAHAGVAERFDHVLSAQLVERFKTAPEVYQLGVDALGLPANDVLFVSGNCWDVVGAIWFGYTTFWVNRANAPLDELGVAPHHTGSSLEDVVSFVESVNRR